MSDLIIGTIACPAYARSTEADPGARFAANAGAAADTFEELRTRGPRRDAPVRFPVDAATLEAPPATELDPAWLPDLMAALAAHYAVPIPVYVALWAVDYGPDVDADAYRDVVRAYLTFLEG